MPVCIYCNSTHTVINLKHLTILNLADPETYQNMNNEQCSLNNLSTQYSYQLSCVLNVTQFHFFLYNLLPGVKKKQTKNINEV